MDNSNGYTLSVSTAMISIPATDKGTLQAFVATPAGAGPHPGIVMGMEAMGLNVFNLEVAEKLARLGYVTIIPDYYRGQGPANPNYYDDFAEVMAAIDSLDFRQGTYDQFAAAAWLRSNPRVDRSRIAVWGYCTGGTLSMLTASLDRDFAAAVLFFPSQPVFEELTPKRPSHPMDLVWNIACPVLIIYGDQDPLMPPERLADLRQRLEQWDIQHTIAIYPGATHAFSSPAPAMHEPRAAAESWQTATAFVNQHCPVTVR